MADQRTRTVADLRPRAGLALDPSLTVSAAAKKMVVAKADAGLVVNADGELKGILTDTDVTRKVLARGLKPDEVAVTTVMTASPQCVRAADNAVDALSMMVERRFRHLPVLDVAGAVVGVLDIAKCLHDAISRLERHLSSASTALSSVVLAALPGSAGAPDAASAQQLVDGMCSKLFSPTLGSLLQTKEAARTASGEAYAPPSLACTESAQAAAQLILQRKSAVLLSSSDAPCIGIVTPKDLLFKLVAKDIDASAPVECVMTCAPDTMPASATVLQALHQLQYGGYRNVPVVDEHGAPLGVLDVLTLLELTLLRQNGEAEAPSQLRRLLTSAESLASVPAPPSRSIPSGRTPDGSHADEAGMTVRAPQRGAAMDLPASAAQSARSASSRSVTSRTSDSFLFKVCVPHTQHMHRIHSAAGDLQALMVAVREKIGLPNDDSSGTKPQLVLRYDDDEGDRVMLSADSELAEACAIAARLGKDRLVVHASYETPQAPRPLSERNGCAAPAAGAVTKRAARLLGGMTEEQRAGAAMGAGAILATLVVGVGALARR